MDEHDVASKTNEKDKEKLLDSSISMITSSISNIFRHSTNDAFRSNICTMLQANRTRVLEEKISESLWMIAQSKYGVFKPAAKSRDVEKSVEQLAKTPDAEPVEDTAAADCFNSILMEN